MKFKIVKLDRGIKFATVTVTMDKKEWTKANKGMLYGVDISNEIYRRYPDIYATCPTVGDNQSATKGIKTITLTYLTMDYKKGLI